MASWERKALTFINQTSEWDRKEGIRSFLSFGISLLRELTGAYMSLELDIEDSLTVRVKEATPSYLNDLIFNPGPVRRLLEETGHRPIYWNRIPEKNAFEELLQALSSAVIIPLRTSQINVLIVLGWADTQTCDAPFREFIDVIRIRLQEIIHQSHLEHTFDRTVSRYSALLHTIPDALVFIAAGGQPGWVNAAAATLLQLDKPGDHAPSILSGAMNALINTAVNKDEINRRAAQLFATGDPEIMIWQIPGKVLAVSCLRVAEKGMLWRFNEVITG